MNEYNDEVQMPPELTPEPRGPRLNIGNALAVLAILAVIAAVMYLGHRRDDAGFPFGHRLWPKPIDTAPYMVPPGTFSDLASDQKVKPDCVPAVPGTEYPCSGTTYWSDRINRDAEFILGFKEPKPLSDTIHLKQGTIFCEETLPDGRVLYWHEDDQCHGLPFPPAPPQ